MSKTFQTFENGEGREERNSFIWLEKVVGVATGCSLGTVNCNVPFIFIESFFLALFLLFLSSIYRKVLLLSGKTCQNSNHNCAKVRASYRSNSKNIQDTTENEWLNKCQFCFANISTTKASIFMKFTTVLTIYYMHCPN